MASSKVTLEKLIAPLEDDRLRDMQGIARLKKIFEERPDIKDPSVFAEFEAAVGPAKNRFSVYRKTNPVDRIEGLGSGTFTILNKRLKMFGLKEIDVRA